MAQAIQALKFARAHLNDVNGITWTDSVLMPLLQIAHSELIQELELHNTGNLKNQSARILVTAGSLNLATNQPANLVNPISMMEGFPGDILDNFIEMEKVTFIPLETQDIWLHEWAWINQIITFLGATTDREIILRYEGVIATPVLATDPLGIIFAENFIGPRIVSLAATSSGRTAPAMDALAANNLYKIIQSVVVNDQRPVRRRGYRSSKRFSQW